MSKIEGVEFNKQLIGKMKKTLLKAFLVALIVIPLSVNIRDVAGLTANQVNATTGGGTISPSVFCYNWTKNLRIGDANNDVTQLVIALSKENVLSGKAALFNEEVASAVVEFQEKYTSEILTPNNLRHGTGFVGVSTRAKLNKLYGCRSSATKIPPSVAQSTTPSKEASKIQTEINKIYELNKTLVSSGPTAQISNRVAETSVKERKELIKNLIKTNPKAFFEVKLSDTERAKLPVSLQTDVEKNVTLEGTTEVLVFDDFDNPKNSKYEYYLNTSNGKIQLYATTPLNLRAGAKVRLTGYQIDTLFVYDSGTNSLQTITPAPSTSALGDHKILVFLVNFLDSNSPLFTRSQAHELVFNDQIQKYYKEQSYNQMSLSGNVYGWTTLPWNGPANACGSVSLSDMASVIQENNINLSNYEHVVYIIGQSYFSGGCATGGFVTYNGVSYRLSQAWVGTGMYWDYQRISVPPSLFTWRLFDFVFSHEFGHNLGLLHAKGLDCGEQILYGNCGTIEYGNSYDLMGTAEYSIHTNGAYKYQLGWLNSRVLDVTSSGRYTISNLESDTGFVTAKISNPLSVDSSFFVEYRKGVGFDAVLNEPNFASNQQGLFVNVMAPNNIESWLLDMTPTDLPYFNDISSATLNYSASGTNVFTDPGRGITIGPVVEYTPNSITFDVTIVPPLAPKITNLTPQSGFSGTQVTITGSNFTPTGNTVTFGTLTFQNLTSVAGAITFTVPNLAPLSYPVTVTNINGMSKPSSFTITQFSVLSPNGGEKWAMGTTQTIKWITNLVGPVY